jgi:hypothetical protein
MRTDRWSLSLKALVTIWLMIGPLGFSPPAMPVKNLRLAKFKVMSRRIRGNHFFIGNPDVSY